MPTLDDCIANLRRRIGDDVTPYTFSDASLVGYMTDAINEAEIDFNRGFSIDQDNSVIIVPNGYNFTTNDQTLFVIKAHYLIVLREKSQSDRNNFLMRKGRLTLDNTNQSEDHDVTLDRLHKEYRRALYQCKNGGHTIQGVRLI